MRERAAQFSAGGVAVVLIGSVAAISRRNDGSPIPPRLVYQKSVPAQGTGYPSVELSFLPPQRIPEPDPDDDASNIEYRVVDRHGRIYTYAYVSREKPFKLVVFRTYGRKIEEPRLVMLMDGEPLGSRDLTDFPPPMLRSLPAKHDPRIEAFREARNLTGIANGDPVAVFRLRTPLAKDETWDVKLLETNLLFDKPTEREPSAFIPNRSEYVFNLPFAEDVEAARIRVTRLRRRTLIDDVRVPNLRLKQVDGKAVVDLKTPLDVPNQFGIRLTLRSVGPDPGVGWAQPDPQAASLDVRAEGTHSNIQPHGDAELSAYLLGWSPGGFAKPRFFAQLVAPMPEELGLKGLIPFTFFDRTTASPSKPLRKEPFDLHLRLRKVIWEKIDAFETTIPVETRLQNTR